MDIDTQDEPPAKRPCLKDFNVQVKMKTPREISLEKSKRALQQKVTRQQQKINDMESLISIVRNYTSHSEIENILQGNFANICKVFSHNPKSKVVKYSDEVKAFALTVHFYSPKAYEFLRTIISLPHTSTLWRSISSFNCDVGILAEVLDYLKLELPKKQFLKNVALIFDSMSLKKDLAYAPKLGKVFGYVDLGNIPVSEPEQLASEALVYQIVSYSNYFKCPIGYFFTPNSLTGELLGQITLSILIHLQEIGITVRSITCDGAKCNIKALETLGCSLSQNDFKPYFLHPNGSTNVYCLLDAAHMLKLARNAFSEYTLTTMDGDVSFQFIKELHEVQETEGLKLCNKITGGHVEYQNKKMNVRLAAQTLSSSVADAIDFLRNSGNLNFVGSEATTKFIRTLDRLFDNMNSRSPFAKHFKSPLSQYNKDAWQSFFLHCEDYMKNIKIGATPILQHVKKTFVLGFLMNISSLKALFEVLTLLPENPLKYFLTFKCSQDNLEIFFSLVRSRGRTQDNPSPLEFRYILRKLLFRNSVQPSVNANCVDDTFHTNHVIDFRKSTRSLSEPTQNTNENEEADFVNNMIRHLESPQQSIYQQNVLYYISGYIVNTILRKNSCPYCKDVLTTKPISNEHDYNLNAKSLDVNRYTALTSFVNRGKLCFASDAVYQIVSYSDQLFKRAVSMGQLQVKNIREKLVIAALQKFQPTLQSLFVPSHPITESLICSDLHETELLKFIANKYLQIRMSSFLKNYSQKLLGEIRTKRQKLHKTILFTHI